DAGPYGGTAMRDRGAASHGFMVLLLAAFSARGGEDSARPISPRPIELPRKAVGNGWVEWGSIAELNGMASYRERITSLARGIGETIWVGTSHGRLLSFDSQP